MNIPKEFTTDEGRRTLANYLRSQNGIKVRSGIEHEKRVDYFKGTKLIDSIVDAKKGWPRSLPKITDRAIARVLGEDLVKASFFHRSEKVPDKKGYLQICKKNVFEENGYYTWMYAGNMVWSNIATGAVIALVIIFTLLPVWPDYAKRVLWYLSVTFIIITLSFCLVRALLFVLMWMLGYDFWVFPRLFDETLSFQDSFKPMYSFESSAQGQGYYRFGLIAGLIAFVYWACTQPTEFDDLLQAQKDFIDDLYSGNLLADVAQEARDHIDRTKRVPNLEDLLKEMEMEALEEKAHEDPSSDDKENSTGAEWVELQESAEVGNDGDVDMDTGGVDMDELMKDLEQDMAG